MKRSNIAVVPGLRLDSRDDVRYLPSDSVVRGSDGIQVQFLKQDIYIPAATISFSEQWFND
jgi:hypothetical protein